MLYPSVNEFLQANIPPFIMKVMRAIFPFCTIKVNKPIPPTGSAPQSTEKIQIERRPIGEVTCYKVRKVVLYNCIQLLDLALIFCALVFLFIRFVFFFSAVKRVIMQTNAQRVILPSWAIQQEGVWRNWSEQNDYWISKNSSLPPANEFCEGNVFTGVCLSTGGVCEGDPRTVKSGRYASYWNELLFINKSVEKLATITISEHLLLLK